MLRFRLKTDWCGRGLNFHYPDAVDDISFMSLNVPFSAVHIYLNIQLG